MTYIATVSRGSLTKRRDCEALKSRFEVRLRRNHFLKKHNLGKYQSSVMYFLYEFTKNGCLNIFVYFYLLFKYKQNPFIGYRNWANTINKIFISEKKDKRYIVK